MSSSQALFGIESQDDLIGTHAFGSKLSNLVVANSVEENCPYGIATIDLATLLRGDVLIESTLPVIRGPRNPVEVAKSEKIQVLPGDYLDSGCELVIKFELNFPLDASNLPLPTLKAKAPRMGSRWKKVLQQSFSSVEPSPDSCPFNRLIYIISSVGETLIQQLLMKINEINAKTLGLESLSPNVLKAALSTYKLTQ